MYTYNTEYECIYKKEDLFLKEEKEKLSPEDEIIIRDEIYRHDILTIFGLKEYDEMKMNKQFDKIYDEVKDHLIFKKCMLKLSNQLGVSDLSIGFMLFYSFEYLYLFHPCICELFKFKCLSEKSIQILNTHILNK